MSAKLTISALTCLTLALISMSPRVAAAQHQDRGAVLTLASGGAAASRVESTLLPYVSLGFEYYLPYRFIVGFRATAAVDDSCVVGNPMFTLGYILPANFHATLMLGYGNFSKYTSAAYNPGWAMDGFSFGTGLGWRKWVASGFFIEPELYFSYSSVTSHQTRRGSTGIFTGLGLAIGFDV